VSNTEYPSLAAALAAVQANLPTIAKGETAEVEGKSKSGVPYKYKYRYADLADVSKVILPMLGAVGLSWITRPTLREDGKFVLAYELMHVSGDGVKGEYPLSGGSPQEIGSAITYARRYALCSVTGVAPEQDDDDGASASRPQQREQWDNARPAAPTATQVRAEIAAASKDRGMELEAVAEDFAAWSKGEHIRHTEDVRLLCDYLEHLRKAQS
jgi:hypothetical protein